MDWEEIYASGKQLNDYPFDDVVSFVRKYGIPGQSILELGCGAGNNLFWAAKEGYQCVGIEQSKSAVEYAHSQSEISHPIILCGDFTTDICKRNIGEEDTCYNLIIDRYATTYIEKWKDIIELNQKVKDALVNGGYFFSQLASSANTVELDPKPRLYNETDIELLFRKWTIVDLKHRITSDIIMENHHAVWNIIAKKE